MSNTSQANVDSEPDVESTSEERSSSKSSFHINWNSGSNTTKSQSPYAYSSCSNLSEDETKEEEKRDLEAVNLLYLTKLEEYKATREDNEGEVQNYCRVIHSAPLALTRLSSRVCSLKVIEEKEEIEMSGDSLEEQSDISSVGRIEVEQRVITPRQREIPPKRKCVRPITPIMLEEGKMKKEQEGRDNKCFPNQIVSIGTRTYIVRTIRKAETRSICTQVENRNKSHPEGVIENRVGSGTGEVGVKSKMSPRKTNDSSGVTILPHSVEDGAASDVTLEPNIIILDDKSPREKLCNSPMGDAPSVDENYSNKVRSNDAARKKGSRQRGNAVGSAEKDSRASSSEISPCSSTNFNIFSARTALHLSRTSDSSSSERTSTECEGNEEAGNGAPDKLKEIESLNSCSLDRDVCRAILGNFRLGMPNAQAGPMSCDDLEMRRKPAKGDTFKEKGLELIRTRTERSNNPDEIKRITPNAKLLIDTRREQSLDMEFYDVTSSTSRESLNVANEIFAPEGTTAEMRIDNDNGGACCFCLKFPRFPRLKR